MFIFYITVQSDIRERVENYGFLRFESGKGAKYTFPKRIAVALRKDKFKC